jgi:hypothetical protein
VSSLSKLPKSPYKDAELRLVEWLKTQPPLIVHRAADHLNWGYCNWNVIPWLVSRSETDEATASLLFAKSCPSNSYPMRYTGQEGIDFLRSDPWSNLDYEIGRAISLNWNEKKYARGNVELDLSRDPDILDYEKSCLAFAGQNRMPWPEMKGLAGPFQGAIPKDSIMDYFPNNFDEQCLIQALYEDLGVSFGEFNKYFYPDKVSKYKSWRLANGFKPSRD